MSVVFVYLTNKKKDFRNLFVMLMERTDGWIWLTATAWCGTKHFHDDTDTLILGFVHT
jgi:hypothetical protein